MPRALCIHHHHCDCQCDTINQKWKWRVKLKVAITDVSTQLDRSHIHLIPCPWHDPPPQLTALVFTVQPAIQPIMITSQCPSPPLGCHLANHLRPETKPQTDKTKTTAKTLDRWSVNILLAFLSNWQFEETRATCHCSQDVQKNLPLVGSRRSETFWSVAKRDLGADGNLGRWPGSLVIRGGAENWWGIETHTWAGDRHHKIFCGCSTFMNMMWISPHFLKKS